MIESRRLKFFYELKLRVLPILQIIQNRRPEYGAFKKLDKKILREVIIGQSRLEVFALFFR